MGADRVVVGLRAWGIEFGTKIGAESRDLGCRGSRLELTVQANALYG